MRQLLYEWFANRIYRLNLSWQRIVLLILFENGWQAPRHNLRRSMLTQWSRACRKSNSSSVQSSSVEDREPTLVSQCSRRSRVWTQCSVSAHFCRTVSSGSWNAQCSIQGTYLVQCPSKGETHSVDSALHSLAPSLQKKREQNPTTQTFNRLFSFKTMWFRQAVKRGFQWYILNNVLCGEIKMPCIFIDISRGREGRGGGAVSY